MNPKTAISIIFILAELLLVVFNKPIADFNRDASASLTANRVFNMVPGVALVLLTAPTWMGILRFE
jgi:hypothetical protein